ncbi:hypothetical protein, partial [Sinorhizobium meliloti]|uniref:hypothetical protein n=1 Tax=Rhizobium meliloti TaxID=382 RepID=UPI001AEC772C
KVYLKPPGFARADIAIRPINSAVYRLWTGTRLESPQEPCGHPRALGTGIFDVDRGVSGT